MVCLDEFRCFGQIIQCFGCLIELLSELSKLICGQAAEMEINQAVQEVLTAYNQNSDTSKHCLKMKQVRHKLGNFIRRTDQILTILFQKRAVTLQEYEAIQSQSTYHNWTKSLIDVLLIKPVTAYHCLLDALISTNQLHLSCLLTGEGNGRNTRSCACSLSAIWKY